MLANVIPIIDNQDQMFHIGDVAKKLRKEKGLSLKELAARSGLRPNTISDLENRKQDSVLSTLEKVAEGLGTTPGKLYAELESRGATKDDPVAMLEEILSSKRKDLADWITGNLRTFCGLVRAGAPAAGEGARASPIREVQARKRVRK